MKKMIICISMMLAFGIMDTNAQSVIREDMIFKSVTKHSVKADTLLTDYKFQDSKGLLYPIIVNKTNGRCWIWKKSGKTGKMYKQYMKEDVCRTICEELGITYIPKQK